MGVQCGPWTMGSLRIAYVLGYNVSKKQRALTTQRAGWKRCSSVTPSPTGWKGYSLSLRPPQAERAVHPSLHPSCKYFLARLQKLVHGNLMWHLLGTWGTVSKHFSTGSDGSQRCAVNTDPFPIIPNNSWNSTYSPCLLQGYPTMKGIL